MDTAVCLLRLMNLALHLSLIPSLSVLSSMKDRRHAVVSRLRENHENCVVHRKISLGLMPCTGAMLLVKLREHKVIKLWQV